VLAVAVTVDFYGESDAEVEAPLVLSLEHQYSMRALQCGGVRDAALARDAVRAITISSGEVAREGMRGVEGEVRRGKAR
jgi:hypothetical protein